MLQHPADVQDVHKIPLLILFVISLLDFVFESLCLHQAHSDQECLSGTDICISLSVLQLYPYCMVASSLCN